ncbi:50S ribosomal protein L25/general stress protein Ctc [Natronospira bacteriovora]|uniref:Large ribosomal subunit protein bL25 n=1 Tax=Natronospira bacteriovora TaxID=3069753 RepID=A0ABU0W3Y5_9GAMM|nr:50S ribosomal protein L25/general stress protein Ctc [Natronospira sp. AB-CW4]MDQ2068735.1 50S ribosomal protein L25/general stress protein Ctc [Natronospira sp. AB-CW4]
MSDEFSLNAEARDDKGKGASRRLRRQGRIPGIIYGGGKEPTPISVDHDELINHLKHEAFYSHVLEIKVGGKKEKAVLKDLQRHVYKPTVVEHIDLQRVSAKEKLRMTVPLHFEGEKTCPGVKLRGGVITHNMINVEVTCLPKDLPEYIEVDVSELDLGDSIHLSDIKLPSGVEIVELMHGADHDQQVVSIHQPRAAKEDVEEEEAEAEEKAEGEEKKEVGGE